MGEDDLLKLYSQKILALAADIPRLGRLEHPSVSVKRRSPVCGSTVTVDLVLGEAGPGAGRISAYAQDVRACALGQAAAAVVGANVIGRSQEEIVAARDALRAMLKEDGPTPPAPFQGLEVLRPAKDFKNRHLSIMLTLEAIAEAMERAAETTGAGGSGPVEG